MSLPLLARPAAALLLLLLSLPAALAQPVPFRAEYRAYTSGLPCGKGSWSLQALAAAEGTPRYQYRAEGKICVMGQRVDHRSRFRMTEQGPVPEDYQSRFKGLFKSRSLDGEFDGEHFQVALNGVLLDNAEAFPPARWEPGLLLYQLGRTRDSVTLSYTWGEETREYLFEYLGSELLDTPLGPLLTHKLVQDHPHKQRVAQFWFAPALDNTLVQVKVSRLGVPWLTVKITDYHSDSSPVSSPSAD